MSNRHLPISSCYHQPPPLALSSLSIPHLDVVVYWIKSSLSQLWLCRSTIERNSLSTNLWLLVAHRPRSTSRYSTNAPRLNVTNISRDRLPRRNTRLVRSRDDRLASANGRDRVVFFRMQTLWIGRKMVDTSIAFDVYQCT